MKSLPARAGLSLGEGLGSSADANPSWRRSNGQKSTEERAEKHRGWAEKHRGRARGSRQDRQPWARCGESHVLVLGSKPSVKLKRSPGGARGSLGSYRRSFALLDCRRSYKSDKRGALLQMQEQPSAGDNSDLLITAACCKQAARALPLIWQLLMLRASKKRQLLSYTLNPLSGLR